LKSTSVRSATTTNNTRKLLLNAKARLSHSYFIHLPANYLQLGQMDQKRDSHWSMPEARPPYLSMTSHQNVKLTTCLKTVAQ